MKKLFLLVLSISTCFLLFPAFQPVQDTQPIMTYENDRLVVHITKQVSRDELMDLKKELLDTYKIILTIEDLQYDNNEEIQKIKVLVDCQDGFSGSASSQRLLGFEPGVYFVRDYRRNAATPFSIGCDVE